MKPMESVSFTIPLHVTIQLGTPVVGQPVINSSVAVGPAEAREDAAASAARGVFAAEAASAFSLTALKLKRFDWTAALSCVLASKLSYEPEATIVETAMNSWGFRTAQFIQTGATQCFVSSTPDFVLIAFRGTENFRDWMLNVNVISTDPQVGYGSVHSGFLSGFRSVKNKLESALAAFPGRPIVLTGHSLGGALATVAAAEWRREKEIQSVYTYGQPCVGQAAFREFMKRYYAENFFRFVNDDDIVPQVPPGYVHVGRLFHFNADGGLFDTNESVGGARFGESALAPVTFPAPLPLSQPEFERVQEEIRAANPVGSAADFVERPVALGAAGVREGLFTLFSDHRLDNYIRKVQMHV